MHGSPRAMAPSRSWHSTSAGQWKPRSTTSVSSTASFHVVQGDLLRPPFPTAVEDGGFDIVYSIGVLHHLPDPLAGFRSLLRFVRPGERSRCGCTDTRTTASSDTSSNRCDGSRPRSHRPPYASLLCRSPRHFTASRAASTSASRNPDRTISSAERVCGERRGIHLSTSTRSGLRSARWARPLPTSRGSELAGWFEESDLDDIAITHRLGNSWRGQGRAPTRELVSWGVQLPRRATFVPTALEELDEADDGAPLGRVASRANPARRRGRNGRADALVAAGAARPCSRDGARRDRRLFRTRPRLDLARRPKPLGAARRAPLFGSRTERR